MPGENEQNNGAGEQQQAAPVQEQAAPTSRMSGVLGALEGFVPKEDLEGLAKETNTPVVQNTPAPAASSEGGEQGTGEGADKSKENNGSEKKDEKKPEPKKEEEGKGDDEKKSVFGFKQPSKEKDTKKDNITIEDEAGMYDVVKSKFGQEVKDIKGMSKFFESAQKWRADAQKVETVQKELGQYKGIVEGLPDDIIEAVQKFYKAEDYTSVFTQKPKFDFSVTAEKQDKAALVNHYYPGKFTEDDFKEETPSTALEIAYESSIRQYKEGQKSINDKRAYESERAKRSLEAYKEATQSSVTHLKESFPDIADNELLDVQSAIEGGPNAFLAVFFNQDGTPKREAAEMLMFAKHGKSEILRMMEVAAHGAETRINEENLSRSADGPGPKKTGTGVDTVRPEVKNMIDNISSFGKQKTF